MKNTAKSKSFKGTLLVSDPGTFVDDKKDWAKYLKDFDPSVLGLENCLIEPQTGGDFSAEIVGSRKGKKERKIGSLSINSGIVGVFLLEEVMAYNPKFSVKDNKYSITVIKKFDGVVRIKPFYKNVKTKMYHAAEVIGKGNVIFRYKKDEAKTPKK